MSGALAVMVGAQGYQVTISPNEATGSSFSNPVFSNSVTVGLVPPVPFTVLWESLNPSIDVTNPTSAFTSFSAVLIPSQTVTGVGVVTVFVSGNPVGQGSVPITLSRDEF